MQNSPDFSPAASLDNNDRHIAIGHIPLLWVFLPLILTFALCFTFDFRSIALGAAFLVACGTGALLISLFSPSWTRCWSLCQILGTAGLALFIFSTSVPSLHNWQNLPPREAELELRWEQVFATRPEAKTISGIARVTAAPAHLKFLVGNDLYCQIRHPVPAQMSIRGAVFQAIGVLDSTDRSFANIDTEGFLRYLKQRRVVMSLTRGRLIKIHNEPSTLQQWCAKQSTSFESILRRGLENNPQSADLLVAMLLGQKSAMSEDARLAFSRTGTMHLFAISGLHIGIIASGLFWIGRRIRCPDTAWRLLILGILLGFVMVTGASPSALRAWLMVACIFAARMFDRNSTPFAGLVLAATLVLLWNPRTLLDIGFQLSYGVVAAILLYGLPLAAWLNSRWVPWRYLPTRSLGKLRLRLFRGKQKLAASLAISFSATLASTPLIIGHFNLFSAGSIAVNLFAIPLATPVIFSGFVSLILGSLGCGFLSTPLNWFSGQILTLLGWMTSTASTIPGMAWTMGYTADWVAPLVIFGLMGCLLALPMRSLWHFLVPPAWVLFSFLLGTF